MPTLNGDAAVASMNARTTNVPGTCLNTVWQAYGSHPSIGDHAGQYPNAIDGWRYAKRRHPGDMSPPAGYPVYFDVLPRPRYAGDTNYAAGDVVISLGGGLVRCTDGAGPGRMGTMTIAQRAAQIGRKYLGWTEDFLGYDIVTSTTTASESHSLITQGDEDMAAGVLIRDKDGGIWHAPDDGDLIPITREDEWRALVATGAVRIIGTNLNAPWVQLSDELILKMRQQIAARKRQQIAATKG